MDYAKESIKLHKKLAGKIETISKVRLKNKIDLSLAYTPGVAEPCLEIAKDKKKVYDYTIKGNTIAVISDGTAVLGLGDIGPEASLPVMEGKCVLFKQFGGVNAFPIVLDTKNTEEIIKTIKLISPGFGGINLEDISAPRCFEIEQRLIEELDIPVFHDDQHGTAIVVLAGIINGLKITKKKKEEVKVIINGVGAAGVAIAKLLLHYGIKDIVMVDTVGTIYKGREGLNPVKEMLTDMTNTACILDPNSKSCIKGGLQEAMEGRDIFIGVSKGNIVSKKMVESMNKDPMIFAMANPTPEISPDLAYEAGAKIVATGRSDYPNQLNNVLVFPGIFAGALKNKVKKITDEMKINAAKNLAEYVKNPNPKKIIPSPFDKGVAKVVAKAIKE
ncbi:NADP-dependent malic enzyme [Candidatus Gracilibacteria bacterium]|nr:NADP-dependent malic enzyme [Candidatus Gracilibacteria bacterium]NUJ99030.1 NADP-dependent malic enzyme [Candidatus Gracilibacteria bacterium]